MKERVKRIIFQNFRFKKKVNFITEISNSDKDIITDCFMVENFKKCENNLAEEFIKYLRKLTMKKSLPKVIIIGGVRIKIFKKLQ